MKILELKTRKCRLLIGYFAFFRRQDGTITTKEMIPKRHIQYMIYYFNDILIFLV